MSKIMKIDERRKDRFYSRMVAEAVKLGVPMDDIIFETKKYHGEEFAMRIEKSMLSD